jgi:anti-anti-sigma regulatory factor
MLRIQRRTSGKIVVLALSGRIGAECVAELQSLLDSEPGTPTLILDLKEVKLVDRDAVKFLADREANGITLESCPAFIREWIGRVRKASH